MAVAITLLALNLAVAGPGHGPLLRQLSDRWPSFVAYLVSFFTIGIIWVNHHALVRTIAVVERSLLFLNLLLLAFVVAIPFATATMAAYLTSGGTDARVAMVMFAATLAGMAVSFGAVFEWTLQEGRTYVPVPRSAHWTARRRFSIGPLIYLIAIPVAVLSPPAALVIIGLVAVYYIFERTPTNRNPTDEPEATTAKPRED